MSAPPLPRSQFPVVDHLCYLNHAGMAPLPVAAREVSHRFLDGVVEQGGVAYYGWDERQAEVRGLAARLLGVDARDVAFVKNTTEGLAFVAQGLTWSPGDRVLVAGHDFPSTVYPWLALGDRGVEVDVVDPVGPGWELPLDRFVAAIERHRPRLVAVSWVNFGRGYRIDLAGLAEQCRERDVLLCVDAIQGLGVVPADLAAWGVDFAAADARKWLLGPAGCGVFYAAPERRELLRPLEPGWASVEETPDWEDQELVFDGSARRFEGGIHSAESVLQLGASLDLLLDAGVDAVLRHVTALLDRARDALADLGVRPLTVAAAEHRAGILTVDLPDHPALTPGALWEDLRRDGIVTSARAGGLRIAPHGYNGETDIDRLVAAIEARLADAG